MKRLPLPPQAGDANIAGLWADAEWLPHRDAWANANAIYRENGGNPWHVAAASFDEGAGTALRNLWKSRKNGQAVRAIRGAKLSCCPLCGSQTTGSVDHYLPRQHFPEFSILFENLVPACVHCNSSSKGDTFRGAESPSRFIHPYYDDWADRALWRTIPQPPFEAATFHCVPEQDLPDDLQAIVAFHLDHVLGEQWRLFNERFWGDLSRLLIGPTGPVDPIGSDEVKAKIDVRSWESDLFNGCNSWQSALLRGIRGSDEAVEHLMSRIGADIAVRLIY
ncbi:conserved hypothetical protein [Sphingomonas aurantiaca]|uniref:HNH endonuclease n=1 Tax=Sphingomonas aurantiaca TaxID=185949 RepID=A0A5E7XUD7_9SPHN|nr:hypothetical protein [Sphingomonas aurantiaca]VVS97856.1 conserved hypothetical protein [Sphingomonas aurantiaca]